ncbi:carbohydrate phosphatase [Lindgomyces ingoldianus]|uniref:Carbohydrate phosphatase n=1 Tax=Lindgomyces ingoldianus TaxID=673940 RepID=A0ACB6QZK9_9PLEO|nr:carbohydrate phosphatase [Lindgomyces ingoldianus]KAF2471636.1 carbohydrate phosphatase [Lindgomyces ingoldianus]
MPNPTPTPTILSLINPYYDELTIALRAIHRASILTKSVLRSLNNSVSAETKADDSPVTVADFAAQALIIAAIHAVYPEDKFVGEESAKALRENLVLRERVWQLVVQSQRSTSPQVLCDEGDAAISDSGKVQGRLRQGGSAPEQQWLATPKNMDEMLDCIDLGISESTRKGRVWVLDPVDGTATFMEGKQYAVCLCLLEDGVQKVGVIGCPNLKLDLGAEARGLGTKVHEDQVDDAGYGVVLSAVKGQGTFVRSMHASGFGIAQRINHDNDQVQQRDVIDIDFVEATLGKTSLVQDDHRAVAERLGAQWPGTVIWSQQLKYVALALGAADVILRIPKGKERYTFIWDHAGGQILFQEAGGVITDFDGREIDFGQGRKIQGHMNFGMVAAMPWCFSRVMQTVKEVLDERAK